MEMSDERFAELAQQLKDIGENVQFFRFNNEGHMEAFKRFPLTPPIVDKMLGNAIALIDTMLPKAGIIDKENLLSVKNMLTLARTIGQTAQTGIDVGAVEHELVNTIFDDYAKSKQSRSDLVHSIKKGFKHLTDHHFISAKSLEPRHVK